MITQIKFIYKDFKKNFVLVIFFIIQLLIFSYFIFIAIDQFLYGVGISGRITEVKGKDINVFKCFYINENYRIHENSNDDKLEYQAFFEDFFSEKNSYSFIQSNLADDTYFTTIIVGDFLSNNSKVKFDSDIKDGEVLVALGENIKDIDIGENINIGMLETKSFKINNRLKKNSYFWYKQLKIDLDDSILINMPLEDIPLLFGDYIMDETFTNSHFVNPDDSIISDFEDYVFEFGTMEVVSFNLHSYLEDIKDNYLQGTYFFFLFFILAVILLSLSIVSVVSLIIEKNMKEYSIHILYGANIIYIFFRIFILIFLIFLIPLNIIYLFSIKIHILSFSFTYLIVLIISVILVSLFLSIISILRINNKEIFINIKN